MENFLNIVVIDYMKPTPEQLEELFEVARGIFGEEEFVEMEGLCGDMHELLVRAKVFKSKRQSKQNWNKTDNEIPLGYSEFVIGKKKFKLCIFNPILPLGL